MCGIAGMVGRAATEEQLQAALASIAHRGPDGSGVFREGATCLLHQRLRIIDLSESASQPMRDEATGVVLVFNGEIYNYRELRQQCGNTTFLSQSDTEVVLRLYLREGLESVKRLRGMFAYAIWDPRDHSLHLARDRFGIKPLYLHSETEVLRFASEVKALLALGAPKRLNQETFRDYLTSGSLAHTDENFFKGITSVRPGTTLTFRDGKKTTSTYWTPVSGAALATSRSDDDLEQELWELLKDSVRAHMTSDVPVGISLSSGLDSAALMHALAHTGGARPKIQAYTFGFEEADYDEIRRIRNTHFSFPFVEHNLVTRPEDVMTSLEAAMKIFEAPLGGVGTLSAYRMMRLPPEDGVRVVLAGEGADEVFGGYKYYLYDYFFDLYNRGETRLLNEELARFSEVHGENLTLQSPAFASSVLGSQLGPRAPDGTTLSDSTHTRARTDGGPSRLGSSLLSDLTSLKLPKLLWFQDRASMAWGVETRVPFLDHPLYEFVSKLPHHYLVGQGSTKVLLRRTLRRFGLEGEKTLKHYVATPQREWLKGVLFEDVLRFVEEGECVRLGLVNGSEWSQAYRAYRHSGDLGNSFFVWKALNAEMFLKVFRPTID